MGLPWVQVISQILQKLLARLTIGKKSEHLRRHEVSEADGGERNKAEVSGVEVRPLLPVLKEERARHDVRRHQAHAQPDGHRFQLHAQKYTHTDFQFW